MVTFTASFLMKEDFKRLLETKQRILCYSKMNSSKSLYISAGDDRCYKRKEEIRQRMGSGPGLTPGLNHTSGFV